MATSCFSPTRASSSDSSALSNIEVAVANTTATTPPSARPADMDDDSSNRASVDVSTPPTSLAETGSLDSHPGRRAAAVGLEKIDELDADTPGKRSGRAARGVVRVGTYNVTKLSKAQLERGAGGSRNASGLTGGTLADGGEDKLYAGKMQHAEDEDWEPPVQPAAARGRKWMADLGKVRRQPSVREKVKTMAERVGSVLGKRGRDVFEAGKRRLGKKGAEPVEDAKREEVDIPRWKRELDTGAKGLLDELDLDVDVPPPPAKKARMSGGMAALKRLAQAPAAPIPVQKASSAGKKMKKWESAGLYAGQDATLDPAQLGFQGKIQNQRPTSSTTDASLYITATPPAHSFMTLPMFGYLERSRNFVIPYDVFAPSWKKGDEKPRDWHMLNKNRLIGKAKELWERAEKLPASACVCQPSNSPDEPGCDDQCLNRVMQYECNSDNCNLAPSDCGNRAFAELSARMKKGGPYEVGVEVIKTANRGFGVRSCRTFGPGQIIMEYTGEIISEDECQRRMREDYKDKQCYYLMELERGLIIDGTKGSMARFINHSCEPNCEVRMVKVNGTPRMGVFAGDDGIATGAELTYDYNFDNFGKSRQICYCGAPTCRGFLSKRLNAVEMKKAAREEKKRKRKAVEDAARLVADEEGKKVKTERGSNWRGWVAVDDPEVKERLKREKKEKEEAFKNSARAQRLAKRERSEPVQTEKVRLNTEREGSKRRRTTSAAAEREVDDCAVNESFTNSGAADELASIMGSKRTSPNASVGNFQRPVIPARSSSKRHRPQSHKRTLSTASKFTEQLQPDDDQVAANRPVSAHSTPTTLCKTDTEVSALNHAHLPIFDGATDILSPPEAEGGKKWKRSSAILGAAVKGVGLAVKSGLKGASAASAGGSSGGELKWRQSTLNFAKLN